MNGWKNCEENERLTDRRTELAGQTDWAYTRAEQDRQTDIGERKNTSKF